MTRPRRPSTIRRSFAASVAALQFFAGAALAEVPLPPAPTCVGRDLLADLRATDAEAARRIDEAAAGTVNGEALLWRVTRAGQPENYLFGTVHLTDDRVTALPPPVASALARSKQLVLEVADLSPQALGPALAKVRDKLLFQDGRSLRTLLSAEELPIAEAATAKAGFPPAMFAVARPWLVTMLLSLSECERKRTAAGKLALDLSLAQIARDRGIPVTGLETLEDQLTAMASVPEDDQLTVLKASLKLFSKTDDMLETMLQRYLAREIGKVWALQGELWRQEGFDPAAFASFQRELITVRNRRMRDTALRLLANGETFIAVGALHLVGSDGLVALLRQSGFTVEPAE